MADFGIRVSKEGQNVTEDLSSPNTRNFQLVSSLPLLLKKEISLSPSNTNRFWGYRLTDSSTKAHPLNYWDGTAKYIIYENEF